MSSTTTVSREVRLQAAEWRRDHPAAEMGKGKGPMTHFEPTLRAEFGMLEGHDGEWTGLVEQLYEELREEPSREAEPLVGEGAEVLKATRLQRLVSIDLGRIEEELDSSSLHDRMTQKLRLWTRAFRSALALDVKATTVRDKFLPLLFDILKDPMRGDPLDDDALLGSDGHTYDWMTYCVWLSTAPQKLHKRSPIAPNDPTPFTVEPHPHVRSVLNWAKKYHPLPARQNTEALYQDALTRGKIKIIEENAQKLRPYVVVSTKKYELRTYTAKDIDPEQIALILNKKAHLDAVRERAQKSPFERVLEQVRTATEGQLKLVEEDVRDKIENIAQRALEARQADEAVFQEFDRRLAEAEAETKGRCDEKLEKIVIRKMAESEARQREQRAILEERDHQALALQKEKIARLRSNIDSLKERRAGIREEISGVREEISKTQQEEKKLEQALLDTKIAIKELEEEMEDQSILPVIAMVVGCVVLTWMMPVGISVAPIKDGLAFAIAL